MVVVAVTAVFIQCSDIGVNGGEHRSIGVGSSGALFFEIDNETRRDEHATSPELALCVFVDCVR